MPYSLNSITIRLSNSTEGFMKMSTLWGDVVSGKLPLIYDSEHNFLSGVSPIACYSNYDTVNDVLTYDLSIIAIRADFYIDMETKVNTGQYLKYEAVSESDIHECAELAWQQVCKDQQSGLIQRAFGKDFEDCVPAEYTKDGKAHCWLYISVKSSRRKTK